ncbi:MAG: peptidoglycan DD-metalloendopeptidase family protein, partial [Chitinivibrionales bacterium]|nr:peptidoglycan DD-metalloendopeptidase family protein [Chitinivibrionales bacterium]
MKMCNTLLFKLLTCFSLALLPLFGADESVLPQGSGRNLEAFIAQDLEAERTLDQEYLKMATGSVQALFAHAVYAWPLQFQSVGWNNSSFQAYGSDPYFHHGVDFRAPAGTPVYTTSGGKIVNVENYIAGNDLYWEVAILDPEGFIWQFHHIDKNSIPQAIYNAFSSGQSVPAGTHIGNIVTWQNSGCSEMFHHTHLNILDSQKNYLNPFAFLNPLPDNTAPEIQEIGLTVNRQKYAGNQVAQAYGLYVRARDLIMHNCFYVAPYDIAYSIDGGDPVTVWRFDNLPGGSDNKALVNNFYLPSYTCGDYTCREFYIDLGFTPQGQRTFPAASGQHTITVTVKDFVGNQDSESFTWTVQDVPVEVYSDNFETDKGWTRNQFGTDNATLGLWERANPDQTTNGSVVSQLGTAVSGSYDLVTGPLAGSGAGSYDLDGGLSSMRSSQINLPVSSSLSFSCRYYFSHGTNSSTDDFLRIKIIGSTTATILEEKGGTENDAASWLTHTYSLNNFSGQSVYILVEAADNGTASLTEAAIDDIKITALISNNAPVVNAGTDQTIALPSGANLSGVVTDDGKPNPPAAVSVQWSQASGPSQAVIANPQALNTTAAFPQSGVYVFRLSASDGELTATDNVSITVNPEPVNQPPVVNSGTDKTIALPAGVSLSGSATDDGLPNPPAALMINWSVVSGPGSVTFTNASALSTQASFSVSGTYELQLAAYDGQYSTTDNVIITVNPQPANQPPVVNSGTDKT